MTTEKTIKPLEKPLTPAELKARVDENGSIRAVIAVDLYELACSSEDGSLDGLNDLADRMILGEGIWGSLADLSFTVVGFESVPDGNEPPNKNEVWIEVFADVSDIVNEMGEDEEEDEEEEEAE